jgi:hypothetical protein
MGFLSSCISLAQIASLSMMYLRSSFAVFIQKWLEPWISIASTAGRQQNSGDRSYFKSDLSLDAKTRDDAP